MRLQESLVLEIRQIDLDFILRVFLKNYQLNKLRHEITYDRQYICILMLIATLPDSCYLLQPENWPETDRPLMGKTIFFYTN